MNLSPKICTICGKSFIPGSCHMYHTTDTKTGRIVDYQCSYTCFNAALAAKHSSRPDRASIRRERG